MKDALEEYALGAIIFLAIAIFVNSIWYSIFAVSHWNFNPQEWIGAFRGVWYIGVLVSIAAIWDEVY